MAEINAVDVKIWDWIFRNMDTVDVTIKNG